MLDVHEARGSSPLPPTSFPSIVSLLVSCVCGVVSFPIATTNGGKRVSSLSK